MGTTGRMHGFLRGLDAWLEREDDDDESDDGTEDEDGDINVDGGAHVHTWSNATGAVGERWCLDCDWLLMPDGTLIQ